MSTEKEPRPDVLITSQKAASWKRKILAKITDGEDLSDDIVEGLGDTIGEQLRTTSEAEMRQIENWWSTQPSPKEIMARFDLQLSMDETTAGEEELEAVTETVSDANTEEIVPEPELEALFGEDEVVTTSEADTTPPKNEEPPAPQVQEAPAPVQEEQAEEDDTHGADKKLVDLYHRYKGYAETKKASDKTADYFVRMMRYVYQNPSRSNQEFILDIFRKQSGLLGSTPFHEHISSKIAHDTASVFSYMYTLYDSLARSIKKRRRINIDPNAAIRALKGKSEIVSFVVERTSKF